MKYTFFEIILCSFLPQQVTLVGAWPDDSYTHPNLLKRKNASTDAATATQDEANKESGTSPKSVRRSRRLVDVSGASIDVEVDDYNSLVRSISLDHWMAKTV